MPVHTQHRPLAEKSHLTSQERRPGWSLNAADHCLWAIDRTLRQLRGPGFETQTFVWLAGRVEVSRLRDALDRLGQHYPILGARLVEPGGPFWCSGPEAGCSLQETDLPTAAPQAVLDHAGQLLSGPTDPAEVAPIRFHLLHRPDGSDVFLVQYNHTLVDHNDALLLLRQVERFAAGEPAPAAVPWRDRVWAYLRRFPRARRRQAALAAERWRRSLRGGAIHLGREAPGSDRLACRLAVRRLEPAATQALEAQAVSVCGMPAVSMAVLASAFRAIARRAGPAPAGRYFNAGIGVDLGISRAKGPALQNLTTLVPLRAGRDDVGDRDQLTRLLNRQLREQLAGDMDLGVLELATVYGRQQRQGRWAIELLLRYCLSLWYGSFGNLRGLGPEFCGVPVEEVFSAGPAWAPVGLTLLVNQFQGRLHLQCTFVPACVPEALVNAFLEEVLADLPRA
jgi:hypothetical protein